MPKENQSREELLKSIDAIVDEALGAEAEIKKSEEHNPANGGDDKIKSGSPMTEEQKAEEAKKSKEAKEKKEEAEAKAKDDDKDMKKSKDEAKAKEDEEEEEEKDAKKADGSTAKDKKMKKSIDDLSQVLDSDELELIKAWREEQEAEKAPEKVDSQEIVKSITQALSVQMDDIKKSLGQKDELIKSLSEQVSKLSAQPAYEKKAIDSLETLEKSGTSAADAQTLNKSQVLDTMFDLQKSGKGITSTHIAEFEVTRTISNPNIRALVMNETKKRFSN